MAAADALQELKLEYTNSTGTSHKKWAPPLPPTNSMPKTGGNVEAIYEDTDITRQTRTSCSGERQSLGRTGSAQKAIMYQEVMVTSQKTIDLEKGLRSGHDVIHEVDSGERGTITYQQVDLGGGEISDSQEHKMAGAAGGVEIGLPRGQAYEAVSENSGGAQSMGSDVKGVTYQEVMVTGRKEIDLAKAYTHDGMYGIHGMNSGVYDPITYQQVMVTDEPS